MTVGITELPPEGMQLGGVALTGDAERGTRMTEGLSLLFTVAGITVQGPQPQIERLLAWSGLDTATCHEKIELPDGRSAAILELTSGGQSIRFLLPAPAVSPGQAAYLDQALPAWLARYRQTEPFAASAPGEVRTGAATTLSAGMAGTATAASAANSWDQMATEAQGEPAGPRRHRMPFARRSATLGATVAPAATAAAAAAAAAAATSTTAPADASTGVHGEAPTEATTEVAEAPVVAPNSEPGPAAPTADSTATAAVAESSLSNNGRGSSDGSDGSDDREAVVLAEPSHGRRTAVVAGGIAALIAVVVVVVALASGSSTTAPVNPSTTTPASSTPASSTPASSTPASSTPSTGDTNLAQSIGLRLADLPAGWTTATPATEVVRPPVTPVNVAATAQATLATCLGASPTTVAGLFASGALTGQTAQSTTAIFQSPQGPSFEMSSTTHVLTSPGQVQALAAVLASPNFVPCLNQFEGAMVAGASPGATAQVQSVTLPAPPGTQAFGVVTTYGLPGAGSQVVGQAFILGGRTITRLVPSTSGAPIPSDIFTQAYNAVVARVGASASK